MVRKPKSEFRRRLVVPFVFAMAVVTVGRRSLMFPESGIIDENELSSPGGPGGKEARCDALLDRFDAIFDERRRARQRKVRESDDDDAGIERKAPPPEEGRKRERYFGRARKRFFDLYEPEANCFTDERFGFKFDSDFHANRNITMLRKHYETAERYDSFGDGPKFVCGVDTIRARRVGAAPDDDGCLVYSVGSNNNVDFEMAVHKFLGCETHTFDPTIGKFIGDEFATFHQWGLGVDGVKSKDRGHAWEGKSFETIVRSLGHEGRTIDILKIDCEGCEWQTLPPLFDAIAAGTITVHQIQIEMHIKVKVSTAKRDAFFEKLDRARMRIFHKERNHWGCDGYQCLEYAFVSEDFLRIANKAAVCDT